ncbi:MAG: GTPase ObgE [Lentisphaerae bacterium]|nr:GTPase ObgE [Lentisphaerota bacterium]
MFVDRVKISVESGHGGSGCISFRREKYVPMGGPDGGDGGNGGDVILQATNSEQSLVDLKFQPQWKAERGGNGAGQKMHGANAPHCRIKVPIGTLVFDAATDALICDLKADQQECVVAKGGIGGKGNVHYVSSVNRAPRKAQPGTEGERKELELELKTVADVGLVGFPNAGKSTFLRAVSRARPKTAAYPFTTLHPNVGVIEFEDFQRLTIADIPGLIDGAHLNVGLGHAFLRHIERCRIFCYVLDMAGVDGRDPLQDFAALKNELEHYEPGLSTRPGIILANKIDLPEAAENIRRLRESNPGLEIFPVCAELGEETAAAISALRTLLDAIPPEDEDALLRILARRRKYAKAQSDQDDDDDDYDF